MDDLIVWAIENFGWGALGIGIVGYLIVEAFLDVVTDLLSNWIKRKFGVD